MGKRSNVSLALDGELTADRTAELKLRLLAAALEGDDLKLDLSRLRAIDAAGAQLLITLGQVVAARGGVLRLTGLNEAIFDAFGLTRTRRRACA